MPAAEPDRACLLIDRENDIWRYEENAWKCQTDYSAYGTWGLISLRFGPIRVFTPQSGDGVGASPAATAEPRTPSAQADQDDRPPTPSSPRTFELVRHHDVSGQTGTGVVAEGVQFSDLTAALRWRGGHPATAVWPNVEEILAVHGHEGATVLVWLDERTCRVCGCTDESACVGGCYWVAENLCSQCGDGPGVPS